jgi:hypothetical protein
MEKHPTIIPEEIHLQKIDVVQTKIDANGFKKSEQYKLGIGHKMLHNLKEERVKIELVFSFKDRGGKEFVFFQIDFHFRIEHLKNFYRQGKNNTPVFFGQMVATLVGICVSTARGILFEKLESNGAKNVIIPVVSPQKMLSPEVAPIPPKSDKKQNT